MATILSNLPQDNSTLANFVAWAQQISTAFSTFGWQQSADTGQVDWATISSPPANNASVYEIWQPNDVLTNFYVRVDYGTMSTDNPQLFFTVCTATNGAGQPTGQVMGPFYCGTSSYSNPGSTNTWECRLAGDAGRIHAMMWRNSAVGFAFSIERSINASGTYTGDHVTLFTNGQAAAAGGSASQQTLIFGTGVAPAQCQGNNNTSMGGISCLYFSPGQTPNAAFNSNVPISTMYPFIGYYDYPLTGVGQGPSANFSEGQIVTTTVYGATHTYIASISGPNAWAGITPRGQGNFLLIRWD